MNIRANNSTIIETTDFTIIQEHLNRVKRETLVLLDVDDCIIIPKSAMFAGSSSHRLFIDDLKKDKEAYPNFDEILGEWRLKRKIRLLNDLWPNLIEQAIKNGASVYALTQLTGIKVGLDNLQEWRYKELSNFNINFTSDFAKLNEATIIEAQEGNKASFYKGIFITGNRKKGLVLEQILSKITPTEVIFVDDRIDHVRDLEVVCKEHNIDYTGICYRGVDLTEAIINDEIIELQKKYLIEKLQWLEDEEAARIIKDN